MSDEPTTTTDRAAQLAAIRSRWTGVAWRYAELAGDAYLVADGPDATIRIFAASAGERATLQLAVRALADIDTLLAALDEVPS